MARARWARAHSLATLPTAYLITNYSGRTTVALFSGTLVERDVKIYFQIHFDPARHFLMSSHRDPRTTAALEKTKFGREMEHIPAIILVLLVGRQVP